MAGIESIGAYRRIVTNAFENISGHKAEYHLGSEFDRLTPTEQLHMMAVRETQEVADRLGMVVFNPSYELAKNISINSEPLSSLLDNVGNHLRDAGRLESYRSVIVGSSGYQEDWEALRGLLPEDQLGLLSAHPGHLPISTGELLDRCYDGVFVSEEQADQHILTSVAGLRTKGVKLSPAEILHLLFMAQFKQAAAHLQEICAAGQQLPLAVVSGLTESLAIPTLVSHTTAALCFEQQRANIISLQLKQGAVLRDVVVC